MKVIKGVKLRNHKFRENLIIPCAMLPTLAHTKMPSNPTSMATCSSLKAGDKTIVLIGGNGLLSDNKLDSLLTKNLRTDK